MVALPKYGLNRFLFPPLGLLVPDAFLGSPTGAKPKWSAVLGTTSRTSLETIGLLPSCWRPHDQRLSGEQQQLSGKDNNNKESSEGIFSGQGRGQHPHLSTPYSTLECNSLLNTKILVLVIYLLERLPGAKVGFTRQEGSVEFQQRSRTKFEQAPHSTVNQKVSSQKGKKREQERMSRSESCQSRHTEKENRT